MIGTQKEEVEWYIVFRSSTLNHWAMRFLKPPFQHVYAMKKSAGGQLWTIIDPTSAYTKVTTEFVDAYPHPRLYAGVDAVIVPVLAKINPTQQIYKLCVFNCVEVVKSLIGLKEPLVLTPWQLYRRLTNGQTSTEIKRR